MHWTARVEWEQPTDTITEEWAVDLVDRLAPFSAAIGTQKESAGDGYPETWSADLTVEAGTLRQAIAAALQEVEQATGKKAVGVEVLTDHEYERRAMQPTFPELVGYAEIAQLAGVSRQRARQFADIIGFPAAVVETQSGPLRVRDQVERWLSTWERKSGRPRLSPVRD